MSEGEILAGLEKIARERLEVDRTLTMQSRLVEELRLDSLRLLTLAVEVENRFRVRLDPEDEGAIETVGDLVRVVERKLAAEAEAVR
jgi:acyl carrier protein